MDFIVHLQQPLSPLCSCAHVELLWTGLTALPSWWHSSLRLYLWLTNMHFSSNLSLSSFPSLEESIRKVGEPVPTLLGGNLHLRKASQRRQTSRRLQNPLLFYESNRPRIAADGLPLSPSRAPRREALTSGSFQPAARPGSAPLGRTLRGHLVEQLLRFVSKSLGKADRVQLQAGFSLSSQMCSVWKPISAAGGKQI
ncbi:hypothetical protein MHYP_G00319990 [Metynnis hypsauchen]